MHVAEIEPTPASFGSESEEQTFGTETEIMPWGDLESLGLSVSMSGTLYGSRRPRKQASCD